MPHHKSAKKRVRTNESRRQRNIAERSRLRHAVRDVRKGLDSGELEGEAAREKVGKVQSMLDHLATKGLIHRNKAARLKSRLVHRLRG